MGLSIVEIVVATVVGVYFAQTAITKQFLQSKNELLQLRSDFDRRCDELESFCRRNEALLSLDNKDKKINIEIKGLGSYDEKKEELLQRESETDFSDR